MTVEALQMSAKLRRYWDFRRTPVNPEGRMVLYEKHRSPLVMRTVRRHSKSRKRDDHIKRTSRYRYTQFSLERDSPLPGKPFPTTSHKFLTSPVSLSTFLFSLISASQTLRFSSRINIISPGNSTRCLTAGSGSRALRLISSSRSGRPRRNL